MIKSADHSGFLSRYPVIIAISLLEILGIVFFAFIIHGGIVHLFAVLITLFYFALPLCVISTAVVVICRLLGRVNAARWAAIFMVAIVLLAALPIASFPLGAMLNMWDLHQAKAYCDDLRVALEKYRDVNGRYPKSLDATVLPSKPRPNLLSDSFYYSDGSWYRFTIEHPFRTFGQEFVYTNESGIWRDQN